MAFSAMWRAFLRELPVPLLAASAAGWMVLAAQTSSTLAPELCLSGESPGWATAMLTFNPPLLLALSWLAMLLAMMPPSLAQPLLYLWHRSLGRRRIRAIALFTIGYGTVWLAAGLGLATLAVAPASSPAMPGDALALLIAALWQATPSKQHCLNRSHRQPPLAAFGLRADTDALRYGLTHGVWCVGSCWALMLIPLMASRAHLAAMAAVMLVQIIERKRRSRPPRWGAALFPRAPSTRIASPIMRSST